MAFLDKPTVDENAKKSEESVNVVRSLFTFRNGFISHPETPDYGVDLNIELVAGGDGATSHMFPVQIKSTARVSVISRGDEKFIALPFKTSRLGYLCHRLPVCGIIVLYDDEAKICYFDYVDAIAARLTEEHGDEEWRPKESVTVHLPLQVLDAAALPALHDKFSQEHARHQMMMRSQGSNYGLTTHVFSKRDALPLDIHNPKQVAKLLEDFGGVLYNKQDFAMLLDLIGRVPVTVINSSKTILFLAALTYAQVGNVIEAEHYLNKCYRQAVAFDATGAELLAFAQIRVAFIKGDTSLSGYRQKLAELRAATTSPLNKLTFEINIVHLGLVEDSDGEGEAPSAAAITELFETIEAAPLEQKDKQFLKLFNSENLHTYGCSQLLKDASRFKGREKAGIPVAPAVRLSKAQALVDVVCQAIEAVEEVGAYAKTQDDQLLNAYALQYSGRFFLALHYCLMMIHIGEPAELSEILHAQYVQKFNASVRAYSVFLELGLLKDAHQALSTCYELQTLFELRYAQSLDARPTEDLLRVLREIENEAGIAAFESAVRPAYEGMTAHLAAPRTKLADIPADQLPNFASKWLDALDLPPDRLPFLLASMEAFRLFEQECENENIELVEELSHLFDSRTAYTRPLAYMLRNKINGLCSPPSKSVQQLLTSFRHLIKKA